MAAVHGPSRERHADHVGAERATGRRGDWPEALTLLRGEAGISLITPRPLTEAASGILIGRLLGRDPEQAFCAACHHATVGNPFLLSELIASVRADGLAPTTASATQIRSLAPPAIARSMVVRLGRMSPEALL